ncbi:phosphatase 2C-like domain-containing protein [Gorgonomyces haynaldii]|nr:phosphatase 2C-like domain-containing protein [Gorgonomyces haynaldii]
MGQTLSEPITEKHTTSGEDERLKWAATGMQGWRITMEDSHTTMLSISESSPKVSYFSVFDGHGGQYAAKWAGDNVYKLVAGSPAFQEKNYRDALIHGYLQSDEELRKDPNQAKEPSGCTAVSILVAEDGTVFCANSGDSRAIISSAGTAHPLSKDHKPTDAVEYQRITMAGGFVEFGRVNGNLALSRALGDFEFKDAPHLPPEKQIVTAYPDIEERPPNAADEFLVVACDGIWDCMSNQDVVNFVSGKIQQGLSLEETCELLVQSCLAQDPMAGVGCDNMTVIIIALLHGQTFEEWCNKIKERLLASTPAEV